MRKSRKIRIISKLHGIITQSPVSPKIMTTPAEDPWKKETELFRPFHWGPKLVLLDIWVWSTTFFEKDKIWLVLIIGVDNKAIKYKIKFCRQSWSYYFANFWCFTIFFFFLPQVKRSVIICNKCGIYKLLNDFTLRIFHMKTISHEN